MIARRLTVVSLCFAIACAAGTLPDPSPLSAADRAALGAEIDRLEKLLPIAPDKNTITYEIARTWAAGKQWPQAVEWLRKTVALNAGLDPSRDSIFAALRGSSEFDAVVAAVRDATPPISHSQKSFQIAEGDLIPESMAYDEAKKQFYIGSTTKGKIVRCSPAGACADFANGLGEVLGLKIASGGLWLLSNSRNESVLIRYDLSSGALRKYPAPGSGHEFNDLVVAPRTGDIYLTDTPAASVWHLAPGAADLEKLQPRFPFANGVALSPDARLLYVSTYPDGIHLLDLNTGDVAPIARPHDLCLAAIDGLYFYRGALIAIQNAFMTPRVARFVLSRDLRTIERFEILERRNALFDGIRTGVIVGSEFYYLANVQDEKRSGFVPITVLKLHL